MKIYFFLLLPALLAACNSSQNQNEKKQNDTIPIMDLEGNKVRDTVFCSMVMPKK